MKLCRCWTRCDTNADADDGGRTAGSMGDARYIRGASAEAVMMDSGGWVGYLL